MSTTEGITTVDELIGPDVFAGMTGDNEVTDAETKRRVFTFVREAPRWARRQLINTGQTTWKGVKVVGKTIMSFLPWLMKATVLLSGVAMIVGGLWLNVSFFQYLLATNPYLFYGFIAAAFLQAAASLGFFAYAKGKLSRFVPATAAA